MNVREAYRICHVYPDKEIPFEHKARGILIKGRLRRMDERECKAYYPFTIELTGTGQISDGTITMPNISRRYQTMEDAVVHIYNGLNEYAAVPDKYSSLEDILFRVI